MPVFSPAQIAQYASAIAGNDASAAAVPETRSASMTWPMTATVAGNAGDALTSLLALRNPGLRESNPLLPQNGALIAAIKLLATYPELRAVQYLRDHGHPTVALALGYGIGAMGGGLAAHNVNAMQQVSR
jgi:hypothetical protein